MFQDFKLIDRMTVVENAAFVLRVMGADETVQQRRAEQALKWVGLEDRLDAYPSELSAGEQQRVAVARALINRPMMVLADEPTGNLDPDLALEIMNLFREINAAGTTVLVATHDRELIRQVGCRAILLEQGVLTEETPAVGHVAPSEAFGLEIDADEVTGDDANIAEPEPFQSVASGGTPTAESDKLAPSDIFAELDAALAGSEPAGHVEADDLTDDEVRRDDTG